MHLREFSHSYSLDLSRKLGDSNPRYGYPYGSLANCWFQPLTQTSNTFFVEAFSLKRGAKINGVFDLCKHLKFFFHTFFSPPDISF